MTPDPIVTTGWYTLDYCKSPYEYTANVGDCGLRIWDCGVRGLRIWDCGLGGAEVRSFFLQLPIV
jgi:hypothetical protein